MGFSALAIADRDGNVHITMHIYFHLDKLKWQIDLTMKEEVINVSEKLRQEE